MPYLKFDWLFGNSVWQANRPNGRIPEPGGSPVALRSARYVAELRADVPRAGEGYTQSKTQTIAISGEDCEVTAHKTGKSTWTAYGYVRGIPIQTDADTTHVAFSRWRAVAKTLLD